MMVYPGMSTNVMAVSVLIVCSVMVLYGLWKVYRLFTRLRSKEYDDVDIQGLHDVFKQDVLKGEGFSGTQTPNEILTDFYKDVQPNDQRYLH